MQGHDYICISITLKVTIILTTNKTISAQELNDF